MTETTINSILTSISILCSIVSFIIVIRARKIKEAVYKRLDTIDLIPFVEKFGVEYKKLSSRIISKNVNSDTEEVKSIVNSINKMIISLNKYLPMLDKETLNKVNSNKARILSEISRTNYNVVPDLSLILSLLDTIDVALRKHADDMKKE